MIMRYCTSRDLMNQKIRANLERCSERLGWSERYLDLIFELLTCNDTDASQHTELLNAIEAEHARMTRS